MHEITDGASVAVQNYPGTVAVAEATSKVEVVTAIVQGGGNDFIITASWDSVNSKWVLDKTFDEISAAHYAGKTIAVWGDDYGTADGTYIEDSPNDFFSYWVMQQNGDDLDYWSYIFDTNGTTLGFSDTFIYPNFTSPTRTYTPTTSQQTETITFDPSTHNGIQQVGVTVNAMPTGTAGTPTATKGTVSNHAVSVTPSVTNTTGYITGGTKTGTAVSVSASELVSGNLAITSSGSKDVTNYATASVSAGTEGTPTASKGTVSNHSISVTPSVTNSAGLISGGTKTGTAVTVSASELVSGSLPISANNTYDVTNYASAVVNVSGGASNFVTGTFTTGSSTGTAATFSTGYTGSGYPIALMIWVDGGPYNNSTGGNTTWYNSVQRYAIGMFSLVKSQTTTTPTYATSGAANYGTVSLIYKNSTSQATTYSRTSSMTANSYTSSSTNANATSTTAVRFKGNGTTVTYFVASTSYGLLASTKYAYCVLYSS